MFKKFLRNFIAKHLYKMITEKDFLKFDQTTGRLFVGKHELSKSEIESFSKSAKDLKQNDAYILIMRELWNAGEKKIFFEGMDQKAYEHGKSVLWALDLFINKVENMARLK